MSTNNKELFYDSKCVIILGMHRSGTSVLAHAIETLGANLGSKLIGANKDNEKGYFENETIVYHNDIILKKTNCRWDTLYIPDFTQDQLSYNSEVLYDITKREYMNCKLWGIKDPRLIRLNAIWQIVFKNLNIAPYYILANRNPYDVAHSLYSRNKIPISISLLLWILHQVDSLELILKRGGIIVDYNKMISNPLQQIERLANFIDIDIQLHERSIECFTRSFINKNLQHNKNNKESTFFPGLDELCNSLYNQLNESSLLSGNIIKNNMQVSKCNEIIQNTNSFLSKNKDIILELSHIKDIHDNTIDKTTSLYEERISELIKENAILQSKIDWITNRPFYTILKKIKALGK